MKMSNAHLPTHPYLSTQRTFWSLFYIWILSIGRSDLSFHVRYSTIRGYIYKNVNAYRIILCALHPRLGTTGSFYPHDLIWNMTVLHHNWAPFHMHCTILKNLVKIAGWRYWSRMRAWRTVCSVPKLVHGGHRRPNWPEHSHNQHRPRHQPQLPFPPS